MAVNSKLNRKTANGWETIHPETHADQVVGLDTALAGVSIDSLNDITDVNAPSPSDGQALVWDAGTAQNPVNKWVPQTISTASGDITSVVAGTGLSGGGTSGDVTLNLDFSELTDITLDVSGTTEMIVAVGATEGRKALSEIKLSAFNNDSGWTSNIGDITSVTAGSGLTGGGTSGGVTLNVGAGTGITVAADTVAVDTSVIATQAYVNTAVANLVDSSPAALDTLNELAAALGDDPNFATTMTNALAGKMSTSHPANNITSTHLYMANGDGFVWNDTTNIMYVRKDGTDYQVIDSGNIGSQSVNYATSAGNADTVDGQHASAFASASHNHNGTYAYYDHFRSLGTVTLNGGTTTSAIISQIEGLNAFDSYGSMFKGSWSYAGNSDLTDAGRLTELAGTSWLTWTDNSSDSTRGNITALVIAPTTGGSANKVFIYNDQGSGYSPGWREVWTSASDGPGSGLSADNVDGYHIVVGSTGTDANTLYFTT